MRLFALLGLLLGVGLPAFGGVPESESAAQGKWQVVDKNWIIDTEDVEIKGDQIRFWVERVPSDGEQSSTQYSTAWKGKLRIRCGDFHARIDGEGRNGYGMRIIVPGDWEKIKPREFAYKLASNFCYITKTPGYTPDPVEHEWQRKLTNVLKASPVKPLRSYRDDDECAYGANCF